MNYNLCSISFRHEMVSFRDLIHFAYDKGFAGIELWGVHAEAISSRNRQETVRAVAELQDKGLNISMISHYVNLMAPGPQLAEVLGRWRQLIALSKLFRAEKIRIFAGNQPSASASAAERQLCAERLRLLAEIAYESGVYTVVEFHPNTYFDTLHSVHHLLQETDHPGLKVNVDFLHVWESNCDPIHALSVLKPWIAYFHLKNVKDRAQLSLFQPENVYSPSGDRDGLASLADGALDYERIIVHLLQENLSFPASLEWFGGQPANRLEAEIDWLKQLEGQYKMNMIVKG